MLSFKPTFSLSSFTFLKRLFSSSSVSAIRVVSSAYLRLLIFLPAILIPACWNASYSPAFRMMFSAYKLIKSGEETVASCEMGENRLSRLCVIDIKEREFQYPFERFFFKFYGLINM